MWRYVVIICGQKTIREALVYKSLDFADRSELLLQPSVKVLMSHVTAGLYAVGEQDSSVLFFTRYGTTQMIDKTFAVVLLYRNSIPLLQLTFQEPS